MSVRKYFPNKHRRFSEQATVSARTLRSMTVAAATDNPSLIAGDAGRRARPVYLDCNATTPVDPRVQDEVLTYLAEEFGNAGSRTHAYGQVAKDRVNRARRQVAAVVAARPEEVIFTSGATESDNLAILGLADHGTHTGRRHIISTQIEHKAVLEPLEEMTRRGFEVTLLPPTAGGWVDPDAIRQALRPDTLLVSVMAVNNETGVIQPIPEIADTLTGTRGVLPRRRRAGIRQADRATASSPDRSAEHLRPQDLRPERHRRPHNAATWLPAPSAPPAAVRRRPGTRPPPRHTASRAHRRPGHRRGTSPP